jgi:hypothetical protein
MTPRNIPEERRSHQHRGGSLQSNFMEFVHDQQTFINENLITSSTEITLTML